VTERYRVLLLVGDDLGDFVSVSKLAPVDRVAVADRYADRWLERWVVLPNPSYGSWSRALTAGVSSDSDVLARNSRQYEATAKR
jgi:acid phosphatase